jgi:hypothetical protein
LLHIPVNSVFNANDGIPPCCLNARLLHQSGEIAGRGLQADAVKRSQESWRCERHNADADRHYDD